MKGIRRTTTSRRQVGQRQLLQELGHQMATLELDALLESLAQLLHSSLGYPIVAIALLEGDDLVFRGAAAPNGMPLPSLPERLQLDSPGLAAWATRHAEPVLVGKLEDDPRHFKQALHGNTRSQLVLPLRDRSGVLGIIDIQSDQADAFDQDDLALMTTVAEYAAVAIKNALLEQAAQEHRRELERLRQTEQLLFADMEQSYNELLLTLSELERRDEQLRRSERLNVLGELASGVAHDFNNLLVGIIGNTELLLADEVEADRRRYLSVIEQAAQDGAAIVRRIQEFARQSEHHADDLVILSDVIDGALAITRPRWHNLARREGRFIAVRRDMNPVPPVLGSAAELRELVINLILNAVDAMPEGGEITVRLIYQHEHSVGVPAAATTHMAIMEVSDSGVGISAEQQAHVFDTFYSTKPAGKGSGLGLAICRQIVARHGGRIELESTPARGTTFRVLLPVIEQPADAMHALPPEIAPAALRILVVDDDTSVRDVLMRMLQRDGHAVTAVSTAEEAIGLFAPGAYDLLFTDLSLSGMDGTMLLSHLCAADPQLLTVIVTGWGQIEASPQFIAGASALVAKPFNMAEIRRVISELTQGDRV